MVENILSEESAAQQIETFLDYYGIDIKDYEPVDNADNAMQITINGLTRAIMIGQLEITLESDSLLVVQKLTRPVGEVAELKYTDKIGQANRAMEVVKGDKVESRKDAFMATLSNTSASLMLKLKGSDRTLYGKIATVFSLV